MRCFFFFFLKSLQHHLYRRWLDGCWLQLLLNQNVLYSSISGLLTISRICLISKPQCFGGSYNKSGVPKFIHLFLTSFATLALPCGLLNQLISFYKHAHGRESQTGKVHIATLLSGWAYGEEEVPILYQTLKVVSNLVVLKGLRVG